MRILLVDDEDVIIEFLRRSLKLDHHVVETARNGIEGFDKASKKPFDVVILDVVMPGKNGVEVCRELRAMDITTPILILSSRDSEYARIQGLDAGADDYLIKPFSYNELAARLRALQRRPQKTLPPKLHVGSIELDPARHIVKLDNKNLDLRPKEYDLLEYMMRNAGTAINRYELLEKVWGVSATNTSNRLDVCIRQLRSKIDCSKDEAQSTIKTVHGFGYKIEAT